MNNGLHHIRYANSSIFLPIIKELVGKTVKVYLDDEYNIELVGKLISYDKKWFELEENKKKNNVIHYKRIDNIKSITLKDI